MKVPFPNSSSKEILVDVSFQWFPTRRGLVGSIVSAGNGYGAVVWIPLQTLYVNPDNVAAVEVDGAIDR